MSVEVIWRTLPRLVRRQTKTKQNLRTKTAADTMYILFMYDHRRGEFDFRRINARITS